jgi:hypothetical protein
VVTASATPKDGLRGLIRLVVHRPRPWVLRYLLATVPALILAVMLVSPLRPWFRVPLLVQGLETRSLDHLLEALEFTAGQITGGPLLALAMLLIPLSWLLARVLWVYFEGGVLVTYVAVTPLSWREFIDASRRWFWSLLLLGVIWNVVALLMGVMTIVIGALAGSLWSPFGTFLRIVGGVAIVLLWLWFSMARSAMVARRDRNVLRALRSAVTVIARRPVKVVVLVTVTLALQAAVLWGSRVGTMALPYSWWFPALILQQVTAMLAMGVTLARRAGEVSLAMEAFTSEESNDV